MIDSALQQIRMIKFARRAPFYWGSPLDPYADAHDATRQELIDSHKRLLANFDAATNSVRIKDKLIPLSSINALYDAAWMNNDTLARSRRNFMLPSMAIGTGVGGLGGYWLGGKAGKGLVGMLGGSEKHKKWGKRIGNILGGLLGASVGSSLVNKYKEDHMPALLDDGTSVLKSLNDSISNVYSTSGGGLGSLTNDDKQFADTTKPGTAKDRKRSGRN